MKKLSLLIAALSACLTLAAQQKGDFTVGGSVGVSGGSVTASLSYGGTTESESVPSATKFSMNPTFSYFVANNFELSAGLGYAMEKTFSDEKDGKNYFDFTHIAMFQVGAHYYVPIIRDLFYYAPGLNIGFGGGSQVSNIGANTKTTVKIPFAMGFELNFANFELRLTPKVGLSFNLLDLDIVYASFDSGSKDIKYSTTGFSAGFNYGASVGARYYF